jgi:hypothetical protein
MIHPAVRHLLLFLVLGLSLGLIALLAINGLLSPRGPLGAGGIVLSFLCSMMVLVAAIGLGRGAAPIEIFDVESESDRGSDSSPRFPQLSFAQQSLLAFAIAYFTAAGSLMLSWIGVSQLGMPLALVAPVIMLAAGLWSIVAATISASKREPDQLVAVLSGLMSVPMVMVTGYGLIVLRVLHSMDW